MSFWAQAMVAANRAVPTPMMATVHWADELKCRMGALRAMRYTPAVTMVAAWIKADTGVGPSIASGSHMYSGIWADLPTAPRNSMSARPVANPPARVWAPEDRGASTFEKLNEWKCPNIRNRAIMNPKSPTRLVTKAFLAATAALSRSNQKPTSPYEQKPTPSQPRKVKRKLSART